MHLTKFNLGSKSFVNMMTYAEKHTKKSISPYPSLVAHFLERLEFIRPRKKNSGFVANLVTMRF